MTSFQRARTTIQVNERKLEIIKAAQYLFRNGGYPEVTFNKIATMTSIKRSTLYTYYNTPDEILLHWIQIEFNTVIDELVSCSFQNLSKDDIAIQIVKLFETNTELLSLFSYLFNLIENNCCDDVLVQFKKNIIERYEMLTLFFENEFPNASKTSVHTFTNTFLPVLIGIYQSTHQTPKQKHVLELLGKQDFFLKFHELAVVTLTPLIPHNI